MKIGILGGTFDPIHEGHLAIAEHALKQFHLSRVEFIPCYQPPHRDQPLAFAADRLAMVKLAVQNHPHFAVNSCEIERKGISYTIDTLRSLTTQNPNNHYFLIIGSDAFSQFDTWHEWQEIVTLADIIVISRDKATIKIPEKLADHIHCAAITPISVSATQIRAEIGAKRSNITGLANDVHTYILKHRLYCSF